MRTVRQISLKVKVAEAFVRRVKNGDFGDKYKFVFDGVDKWLVRCFDTLTKGKKQTLSFCLFCMVKETDTIIYY